MIYTHVIGLGASAVRSPLDALGCPEDDSPSRPEDNRAMTASGMSQPVGLEDVTIRPDEPHSADIRSRRRFRRQAGRGSITS
jgi:hypothetical protein